MITALTILSLTLVLVSGLLFANMRAEFRYHLRCKIMLDTLRQSSIPSDAHARLVKNARAIDEMPFSQLFILYVEDDWKTPLELGAQDGQ
jgi:hypothetical protein